MTLQRLRENQRLDALIDYDDTALYDWAQANAILWEGQGIFKEGEVVLTDVEASLQSFSPPAPEVLALLDKLLTTPGAPSEPGFTAVDWTTGQYAQGVSGIEQAVYARLLTHL